MSEATVLFCQCVHARVVPGEVKRAVHEGLLRGGLAFETVTDLCGLAARRDPWLKGLGERDGLTIVACYPRAVRWLFHAAGAGSKDGMEIFNMRETEASEIVATLLSRRSGGPGTPGPGRGEKGGWVPWFPVIDYDRCSGCLQCKKFCLFGVFGEGEDGRTRVQNPANCKTNCPACARICPETAIIFPKYGAAPINGSDEIIPGAGEQSRVDLKNLLKGDLYEVLRNRGGDKGDVLDAARKLAEAERLRCARASGAGTSSTAGCCDPDDDRSEPCCGPNTECCDPAAGCCDPGDVRREPCCDPATGCCGEDAAEAERGFGGEPGSGCFSDEEEDRPCCG